MKPWYKSKRFRASFVAFLSGLSVCIINLAQGDKWGALGSLIASIASALTIWWNIQDSGIIIEPPNFIKFLMKRRWP